MPRANTISVADGNNETIFTVDHSVPPGRGMGDPGRPLGRLPQPCYREGRRKACSNCPPGEAGETPALVRNRERCAHWVTPRSRDTSGAGECPSVETQGLGLGVAPCKS